MIGLTYGKEALEGLEEEDFEFIIDKLSDLNEVVEEAFERVEIETKREDFKVSLGSEIYPEIKKYVESYKEEQLEKIRPILDSVKDKNKLPPPIKVILRQLEDSDYLRYFSFDDYIDILLKELEKGKDCNRGLVEEIVRCLIVDYIPKDTYDVPYLKWSEEQILSSTRNLPIGPIATLYKDIRKWNSERLKLAKSLPKERQGLVVSDNHFIWLWERAGKESSIKKVESIVLNLTRQDIYLREFLERFLFKISYLMMTTFLLYDYKEPEILENYRFVIDLIEYLLSEERNKFSFTTCSDYLLEEQVSNQFILKKKVEEIKLQDLGKELSELIEAIVEEIDKKVDDSSSKTDASQLSILEERKKRLEKLLKGEDNPTLKDIFALQLFESPKKLLDFLKELKDFGYLKPYYLVPKSED